MVTLQPRRVETALAKARLAAFAFALVVVVSGLLQIDDGLPGIRQALGYLALIALAGCFLASWLRGRTGWWEVAAAAPLLALVTQALRDKPALIAIALAVIASQTLYGSGRMVVGRTGTVVALLAVLSLMSEVGGPEQLITPMAVLTVFTVLMRSMYRALLHQQETAAWQSLLAHTGRSLLGVHEVSTVRAVIDDAFSALSGMTPGLAIVLAQRREGHELVQFASERVRELRGTQLAALPDSFTSDDDFTGVDPGAWPAGHEAFGAGRRVLAMRIGVGSDEVLVVSSRKALSIEICNVLSTLTTQMTQAEVACRTHAELVTLAHHDGLTTISNRSAFFQRVIGAVEAAAGDEARLGLLMIDLDDFKTVNDTLGHAAGDIVLKEAGQRLLATARAEDGVARPGGDEFVVVTEPVGDAVEVEIVAERCLEAMRPPFVVDGRNVYLTASVGVAIVELGPEPRPVEALRDADIALYEAKRAGRNRLARFDEELHRRRMRRLELENRLRGAIVRDELRLAYQPLWTPGRSLVGFEALLRWHNPGFGPVGPDEFIPIAEDTGLIIKIGAWVLRVAIERLAALRTNGETELVMSINLSPRQLKDPELVQELVRLLAQHDVPPDRVMLEVTESVLMDDDTAGAETLEAVRRAGVRLALDDFGTGFSSLASLRTLPVDVLKIDRAFVSGTHGVIGDDSLVSSIVDMAQRLGLSTVAEGVETEEQLAAIRAMGCDLAQGFLLGRPLESPAIDDLVGG